MHFESIAFFGHLEFFVLIETQPPCALCSPVGGMNFESAPFKLSAEYVELMGGQDSDMFQYFKVRTPFCNAKWLCVDSAVTRLIAPSPSTQVHNWTRYAGQQVGVAKLWDFLWTPKIGIFIQMEVEIWRSVASEEGWVQAHLGMRIWNVFVTNSGTNVCKSRHSVFRMFVRPGADVCRFPTMSQAHGAHCHAGEDDAPRCVMFNLKNGVLALKKIFGWTGMSRYQERTSHQCWRPEFLEIQGGKLKAVISSYRKTTWWNLVGFFTVLSILTKLFYYITQGSPFPCTSRRCQ